MVDMFAFDTVTTFAFKPTQEYVQEAIKAPAVQTWLREPKQRFVPVVSLFLIIGMKLVKGARIKYATSQSTKVTSNVGIDMVVLGTTIGPKGHWLSTNDDETQFDQESEFVFAFRIKRLKFGWKLKVEDYNTGAVLAVDGEQDDDEAVLVEDVDGSELENVKEVHDVSENGSVYCIPP